MNYTYQSNVSTEQFQYGHDVEEEIISNGTAMATQDRDDSRGLRLACGLVMEGKKLCNSKAGRWEFRAVVFPRIGRATQLQQLSAVRSSEH